ncbi:MAG: hypothetical protein RSH52_28500, partial [Janthinobacterium sp.]
RQIANSVEKNVYAPSLRESRLHRSCNRITRGDAEVSVLDYKDKYPLARLIESGSRVDEVDNACRFRQTPYAATILRVVDE